VRFSAEIKCKDCGEVLAQAGTYATLRSQGAIVLFNDADPPAQLAAVLECSNGHRTIPKDACSIEPWFLTPLDTPIAPAQAIVLKAVTGSGEILTF
jgi:hypothetical protein